MGRKKKEKNSKEINEKEREPALGGDAKRSIVAIFLFALSVLFLLAFIGQAGAFGKNVGDGLGKAVGWGRWPLIPLLVLIGIMLLKRHKTTISDRIKYVGLTFAFLSVLGLAHLFLGDTAKELEREAQAGNGGGYLGYLITASLSSAMGKVASFVVLFSLFVSGGIAAFNVSLLSWFEKLRGLGSKEEVTPGAETAQADPSMLLSPEAKNEELKETSEESSTTLVPVVAPENVQNIRFVGDDLTAQEESENREENGIKNISFEEEERPLPVRPVKRRTKLRWEFPPLDLLEATTMQSSGGDIEQTKQVIVSTLKYFGINVEAGEVQVGPTVTQYTFRPAVGVKLSRITTLHNDLALALAAHHIRIEAPIPGKSLIGIEVPNKSKTMVRLRDILESKEFRSRASNLTMVLGQDVSGKYILADLEKMPHLLIAGTTRSGKSVCINTLILSLLYQNSPEDLKLILVDPKRVELTLYKGIPHLKTDVIVDNHKVVNVLKWAVAEMDTRYKILEAVGSRDLFSYRDKVSRGEKRRSVDLDTNQVKEEELEPLPQIVIIIDEMADLMGTHGKEVENQVIRLAQKARAVGLHLVLATQRPEVNVITGLIKANMPARISFQLKSQVDSRTILDAGGAEKLLGNGDMLYSSAEASGLQRIQGVFVSENEVKKVTKFLEEEKIEKGLDEIGEDFGGGENPLNLDTPSGEDGEDDPYYEQAKRLVVETQRVSTTYLQTYLKIGYPKAARITELLEKNGIIGPAEGSRRPVLVKSLDEGKRYGDDPLADQSAREKFNF
ncbi:MAG: DNA translocase FtsK [Candidatus Moraniibacteriota bacterium]